MVELRAGVPAKDGTNYKVESFCTVRLRVHLERHGISEEMEATSSGQGVLPNASLALEKSVKEAETKAMCTCIIKAIRKYGG